MAGKFTIQDIARLAGVSPSTVSRVLNKKPDVDAETRERVLQIVDEHEFVPNHAAARLAGGRSKILGVIVSSLTWPFIPEIIRGVMIPTLRWPIIPEILRGITETAGQTSYELMLYSIHQPRDHSDIIRRILSSQLISGLVTVLPGQASKDLVKLYDRGLPMVVIDDQHRPTHIPWVGTDNRYGAYNAVRHLIELGHTRIAHIRGPYECSQERYLGYLDALQEAGIAPDPTLTRQGDFEVASGQECGIALYTLPERPTAIFAGNDQMAYGAMTAAENFGIRIPEDIAIVGFDDIPFSAHINPPLTTIHQPFFEMGQNALELLISLIESSSPSAGKSMKSTPSMLASRQQNKFIRVQLPAHLIVRESSGAPLTNRSTSLPPLTI